MTHTVVWSQHAVETLERLDRRTREHLFRAAGHFVNGGEGDVTRAHGSQAFRLRAGKWRLLMTLEGDTIRIHQVVMGGVAFQR